MRLQGIAASVFVNESSATSNVDSLKYRWNNRCEKAVMRAETKDKDKFRNKADFITFPNVAAQAASTLCLRQKSK